MATSKIKRGGIGAPTTIDLNSNWTAPSDGIVNAVIGWQVENYGYMYIKDYTADELVGCISNGGYLAGFTATCSFPVIKGHTYKVDMQNKVGSINTKFYEL